jgi:hypothetical protein
MSTGKKKKPKPSTPRGAPLGVGVRLLVTRYRLLDKLLRPVLFMFKHLNKRQERIQRELIKRGWEDTLCLPDWLVRAHRREESQ